MTPHPERDESRRETFGLSSNLHTPSVRSRGVTLSGEVAVACEVSFASWSSRDGLLAVDVVFHEDARGLLEIVSWSGGGVADALTAIAIDYLGSVLGSETLVALGTPSPLEESGPPRFSVPTGYVHAALAESARLQSTYQTTPANAA
jgi:hypothetical protein